LHNFFIIAKIRQLTFVGYCLSVKVCISQFHRQIVAQRYPCCKMLIRMLHYIVLSVFLAAWNDLLHELWTNDSFKAAAAPTTLKS